METPLMLIEKLLRVGTPHRCLWAGDLDDELVLLSIILRERIVVFER